MPKYFAKKANAIIEYSVVIAIIVAAIAGINHFLRRSVQARIKYEIDTISHYGRGSGLEWEENTLSWRDATSNYNRVEAVGGDSSVIAINTEDYTTLSLPMPPYVMEHKNASRDVQDAAVTPPKMDEPNHKNQSDNTPGQGFDG
jgi:hypothetical protein